MENNEAKYNRMFKELEQMITETEELQKKFVLTKSNVAQVIGLILGIFTAGFALGAYIF